jgi:hypothetical protein
VSRRHCWRTILHAIARSHPVFRGPTGNEDASSEGGSGSGCASLEGMKAPVSAASWMVATTNRAPLHFIVRRVRGFWVPVTAPKSRGCCDGGRPHQQGLYAQVARIGIPSNGEHLMSTCAVLECLRSPLAPALACKRCR